MWTIAAGEKVSDKYLIRIFREVGTKKQKFVAVQIVFKPMF